MPEPIAYNENELLAKVALGEETAFRELFERYKHKIYSFALYLTHSDSIAEEVTQEIFIKIWNHRSQLQEINYFKSWLRVLIRNHTYTILHRIAQERIILKKISVQTDSHASVTEIDVLTREYNRLLDQAIARLPTQQKKVYVMSRKEGMKHDMIADEMGISLNTVKNHMKAALRSIRLYIEDHTDILVLTIFSLVKFF